MPSETAPPAWLDQLKRCLLSKLWQAISSSTTHLCQTLVWWESRESSNSRRTALLLATFTRRTDSGSGPGTALRERLSKMPGSRSRLSQSYTLCGRLA